MNNGMYRAILNPSSPRYETWKQILGEGNDVPLLSCTPVTMDLPPPTEGGDPMKPNQCQAYQLGIASMTPEQRSRLIDWVEQNYKVERKIAIQELEGRGFPIRATDIILSFSLRGFM